MQEKGRTDSKPKDAVAPRLSILRRIASFFHLKDGAHNAALQSIDVRKIFEIEFECVLRVSDLMDEDTKKKARDNKELVFENALAKYNKYTSCILKAVAERKIDVKDEKVLFPFITGVLYNDLKATWENNTLLLGSLGNNKFNCYTSTILLADVCIRLGKRISIILAPEHVLLSGRKYCLETTSADSRLCIYPKQEIKSRYAYHQSGGLDYIYIGSYVWASLSYTEKGWHDRAIECCNAAIGINPKIEEVYNNLGRAYLGKKEYAKAIECFDISLRIYPRDGDVHLNIGTVHFNQNEFGKAKEYFEKAIGYLRQSPRSGHKLAVAYHNMGNAYCKSGEYDAAIESYKKAIEINPNDADSYTNMGSAYLDKKDYATASTCLNKAIGIDPNRAAVYHNLGVIFSKNKEYDAAIEHYKKALEKDPDLAPTRINLELAYLNKGDFDGLKECCEEALRKNPEDINSRLNLGVAYLNKNNPDKAIEICEEVLQKSVRNRVAYHNLSAAYRMKGDTINADKYLKIANSPAVE